MCVCICKGEEGEDECEGVEGVGGAEQVEVGVEGTKACQGLPVPAAGAPPCVLCVCVCVCVCIGRREGVRELMKVMSDDGVCVLGGSFSGWWR